MPAPAWRWWRRRSDGGGVAVVVPGDVQDAEDWGGARFASRAVWVGLTCAARQMDAREEQLAVWTCCRLTRQPLGGEDGKAAVVRGLSRPLRCSWCADAYCSGNVPARLPVQPRARAAELEGVPRGRRANACAGEAHRVAQGPDHAAAGTQQQRRRRSAGRRGFYRRLSRRHARAFRVPFDRCDPARAMGSPHLLQGADVPCQASS